MRTVFLSVILLLTSGAATAQEQGSWGPPGRGASCH